MEYHLQQVLSGNTPPLELGIRQRVELMIHGGRVQSIRTNLERIAHAFKEPVESAFRAAVANW